MQDRPDIPTRFRHGAQRLFLSLLAEEYPETWGGRPDWPSKKSLAALPGASPERKLPALIGS